MPRYEPASALRIVYVAVGLFLALLPLGLQKPGVPGGLKADESAYLMMASSLAFDGDLVVGPEDTERLFDEYPLRWTSNLIVFSDDGWQTVRFGKPYVYSLAMAPFFRLFGSNGLLAANLLMLWAMVGLGWRYLARWNGAVPALLFSGAYFLLSASWSYAFWLQPELFNMFCVMAAIYLGFSVDPRTSPPSALRCALAGAVLALPVYNKPMLLLLATAIVLPPLLLSESSARRRLTPLVAFSIGLALTGALLITGSLALTGHASAYGVPGRQGVRICEPGEVPRPVGWEQQAREARAPDATTSQMTQPPPELAGDPENRSFYWLLRLPEVEPGRWVENLAYFFWGRHTGLLHYFPFALLALVFLLVDRELRTARFVLLASIAAYAAFFLLLIGWNWQGGGGFVGNRYFVNAIPAALFLVRVLRPLWTMVAAAAWAGLVIGPLLLTPFGLMVPEPTLQAHTRNWPLRLFPLELTLKNVPGYRSERHGDLRTVVRADRAVPQGAGHLVAASRPTRLLLISSEQLGPVALQLRGVAPDTDVRLRLGGSEERLSLSENEVRVVELDPGRGARRHAVDGPQRHVYELEIETDRGALVPWTRHLPPWPCESFEFDRSVREVFYAGAELIVLGPAGELDRDVYAVSWDAVQVPAAVAPRDRFPVQVTLTNRSDASWQLRGAAQIHLSYHWLDANGEAVEFDGLRADVPPLEPGGQATVRLEVEAPRREGDYVLELDLVREHVNWFAERTGGQTHRSTVRVGPLERAEPDSQLDGQP